MLKKRRMKKIIEWPKTEADLAKPLVTWLEDLKWEVYKEVAPWGGSHGGACDIVAKQGSIIWAIEVKKTFSNALLAQAFGWVQYAHYVSVAIPEMGRHCVVKEHFLRCHGMGLLEVKVSPFSVAEEFSYEVMERIGAKLHRKALPSLRDTLCEEQKTYSEAGNAINKRWTPFQATCERVKQFVQNHPGCTLKEMLDKIKTHYPSASSARSALAQWIRAGSVEGVEARMEGRRIRLYAKEGV